MRNMNVSKRGTLFLSLIGNIFDLNKSFSSKWLGETKCNRENTLSIYWSLYAHIERKQIRIQNMSHMYARAYRHAHTCWASSANGSHIKNALIISICFSEAFLLNHSFLPVAFHEYLSVLKMYLLREKSVFHFSWLCLSMYMKFMFWKCVRKFLAPCSVYRNVFYLSVYSSAKWLFRWEWQTLIKYE